MADFDNKAYQREYYKQWREELLEKMREKVTCETCNCKISRCNVQKHKRSNKHILNEMKGKPKEEVAEQFEKLYNNVNKAPPMKH